MPIIPIDSIDDERLRSYRDLPRVNLTRQSGLFVVEGKWLVERLAASDYPLESIVVDAGHMEMLPGGISEELPVYVLPSAGVEHLIGFNFHRGILACGRRKVMPSTSELVLPAVRSTVVACIDIQDPTNLGGILRNCAAFGVDAVLLNQRCADPFSRRVLRVAMGTVFKLQISMMTDGITELRALQSRAGHRVIASVLSDNAEELEDAKRSDNMVLLFGNEGHGLPTDYIELADRRVTVTMKHGTDSLNAAAASAVFLFHFTRDAVG